MFMKNEKEKTNDWNKHDNSTRKSQICYCLVYVHLSTSVWLKKYINLLLIIIVQK